MHDDVSSSDSEQSTRVVTLKEMEKQLLGSSKFKKELHTKKTSLKLNAH